MSNIVTPKLVYDAWPDKDLLLMDITEDMSLDTALDRAEDSGDTLFSFVMKELCGSECDQQEALGRLNKAMGDLLCVAASVGFLQR